MITVPMRMSFTILLPFVYIVSLEKEYELSNTKFLFVCQSFSVLILLFISSRDPWYQFVPDWMMSSRYA